MTIFNIPMNEKKILIVLVVFLFQSKAFGQDFEWVYTVIGRQTDLRPYPTSQIIDIITDNQDNIYVTGRSAYKNDYSNGNGNIVFNSETELVFVMKLSKNKNILWVKHFNVDPNVVLHAQKLHIDANQNLYLSGFCYHSNASFIDLNPDPGEQHTIENPSHLYGVIIKLNPSGNYINSWHFEDCDISGLAFDSNDNVIALGNLRIHDLLSGIPAVEIATLFKLDSNLNTIWTKTLDGYSTEFYNIAVDNYDDLIITGHYYQYLNFAGENFHDDAGLIICKISKDGSEEWILDRTWEESAFGGNNNAPNENLNINSHNHLFITYQYNNLSQFKFKNTTIANLPYEGNTGGVVFGFDTHGNYISHFTFSGIAPQYFSSLVISESDEFIIGLVSSEDLFIRNSNGYEKSFETEKGNILLKVSASHELINYKEIDHQIRLLNLDNENNIIMAYQISRDTDFDPHPINTHIVSSIGIHTGFVLKLSYCDSYPPTGDATNTFCSDDSATIADLEINDNNVNWYASNNSTIPLNNTTLLVDGQTYYAAKEKADNCPDIAERLAVSVTIHPVPPAPVLNPIQPCFASNIMLSDLILEGTNLAFYGSPTTTIQLNSSTLIEPEKTYYVTQKLEGCESPRTAITIMEKSAVNLNDHAIALCDADRNNLEEINLSNYVGSILDGNANDFTISYHLSEPDAQNNSNAILDHENFQTNNQIIYIRFVYNNYSCFEIGKLTITVSSPPEIAEVIIQDGTSYNNSVTLLPFNPGYQYSINGITYQQSNLFENLPAGEYFAYVRDNMRACPEIKEKFYLLTYPKFFTPNGDGYNDFWKIKYALFQFTVDVQIYDRYGKLITTFDKNSPGWDGSYNGEQLPSTDYWFRITRLLDQKIIHKGHFSLKR